MRDKKAISAQHGDTSEVPPATTTSYTNQLHQAAAPSPEPTGLGTSIPSRDGKPAGVCPPTVGTPRGCR